MGRARAESDSEAVRLDGDTNITVDDIEGAINESLRGSSGASLGDALKASAQRKTFEFDGVFGGESEQAEVFKEVGLPVVDAVLAGYHGCVFAYGQTGSGKTYSLLHGGSAAHSFQDSGLLPRLAATLYVKAARDVSHDYTVEAGCFQVYNEQVSDLLHPEHRSGKGANLSVSKDRSGHGQFASRKNVVYAETKMNKASSRSHACFQLRVSRRPKQAGARGTVSLCSVVDLAGSERVKRSGVAGKELKEAININGSLLALGNVVAALAAKKKHVPYRDSKLTRVLEGSVGGNCKTTLLCCCSPSADSTSETLAALAFAARAMRCECKAVVNEADVGDMPDCGACRSRGPEARRAVEALAASEAAAKEARAEKQVRAGRGGLQGQGSRAEEARKEAAAEAERLAAKEKQVKAAEHAQKATGDDLDAARKEIDDIMRELREAKETLATRAAVSEDEVNAEQARRDDIAARLEAEEQKERQVLGELDVLASRFNARESRGDDLEDLEAEGLGARGGILFSSISGGKRGAAAKKVVDVHGLGPTLDRYALALAATEPLRAARDRSVRRAIGRVRFFLLTGPRRCNACDPQSNAWRSSCQQYAAGSSRVLDAFGFAPSGGTP
ncbi:hypothetical protein JL720_12782 [Aureococcus anophagefferens]|nr:hypothetical protein JL720_12782 [Aureococcus anophagefferens]